MNLIKSAFALLLSVACVSSADTNTSTVVGTTDMDVGEVTLTESGWRSRCRCDWGNKGNGCFDQRVSGCTDLEDNQRIFECNSD